jgi:hypothetical protein
MSIGYRQRIGQQGRRPVHWRYLAPILAVAFVGLMLQAQSGVDSSAVFAMQAAPSVDVAAMQAQAGKLPVTFVADYI